MTRHRSKSRPLTLGQWLAFAVLFAVSISPAPAAVAFVAWLPAGILASAWYLRRPQRNRYLLVASFYLFIGHYLLMLFGADAPAIWWAGLVLGLVASGSLLVRRLVSQTGPGRH